MIATVKTWCREHRSLLLYLLFGVLTTAVDWGIRFSCYSGFATALEQSPWLLHLFDLLAWIGAVLFAYVTNRIWVFHSKKHGWIPILSEAIAFAGSRVLTLALQEGFMFLFCTVLGQNKFLFTLIVSVLVVLLNYVISKLLVFRKQK